jgi:hypothetical protein
MSSCLTAWVITTLPWTTMATFGAHSSFSRRATVTTLHAVPGRATTSRKNIFDALGFAVKEVKKLNHAAKQLSELNELKKYFSAVSGLPSAKL